MTAGQQTHSFLSTYEKTELTRKTSRVFFYLCRPIHFYMTEAFLNKSLEEIKKRFNISQETVENTSLIAFPNQHIKVESWHPVLTVDLPSSFQIFQWGFILFWMPGSNLANRTINAAVETAFDKPAFQKAITSRRCIIPVDGFYEHRLENGQRKKYRIARKDNQTFAVAGIWEQFPDPKGVSFNAFLPLTCPVVYAKAQRWSRVEDFGP